MRKRLLYDVVSYCVIVTGIDEYSNDIIVLGIIGQNSAVDAVIQMNSNRAARGYILLLRVLLLEFLIQIAQARPKAVLLVWVLGFARALG